jgi:WD40 repeat protein
MAFKYLQERELYNLKDDYTFSHRSFLQTFVNSNTESFQLQRDYMVPPFACKFVQGLLAVADEAGYVSFFNKDMWKGPLIDYQIHNNAIFDMYFLENSQMITASGDLSCRLFDFSQGQTVCEFKGHESSVKCLKRIGNRMIFNF